MTTSDESHQQEVRSVIDSLLRPKHKILIGAWNVRGIQNSPIPQRDEEIRTDILGVSECQWTISWRLVTSDGLVTLYSGHENQHRYGVALIISMKRVNTLLEWEPLGESMVRAHFDSKHFKLNIIQCYAPKNEAVEEDKNDWYDILQHTVSGDMLLVLGDMNAKVGADNTNCDRVMGSHDCGEINVNCSRLIDFCLDNNLVAVGTLFQHKDIHKLI